METKMFLPSFEHTDRLHDMKNTAFCIYSRSQRTTHDKTVSCNMSNRSITSHVTCGLRSLYKNVKDKTDLSQISKSAFRLHTSTSGHFLPKPNMLLAGRYCVQSCIESNGQSAVLVRAEDCFRQSSAVAIKVIHTSYMSVGLKEECTLRKLNSADIRNSAHIVQLLDSFMFGEHICLVFPLLNYLPLTEVMTSKRLEEQKVWTFLRKVSVRLLSALAFLRCQNTIHADVKPENILFKKDGDIETVTLIDFGNAIHFTHTEVSLYYTDFELQTPPYRAPEVHLGNPFSVEIDMWSLGCVLLEMYTGQPLFIGTNRNDMLKKMISVLGPLPIEMCVRGKFYAETESILLTTKTNHKTESGALKLMSAIPKLRNYQFASFLSGLLAYHPGQQYQRLTPWEALQHPFLAPEICIPYFLPDADVEPFVIRKTDYSYKQNISSNVRRLCPTTFHLLRYGTADQLLSDQCNIARVEPLDMSCGIKREQSMCHQNQNLHFPTHNYSQYTGHQKRDIALLNQKSIALSVSTTLTEGQSRPSYTVQADKYISAIRERSEHIFDIASENLSKEDVINQCTKGGISPFIATCESDQRQELLTRQHCKKDNQLHNIVNKTIENYVQNKDSLVTEQSKECLSNNCQLYGNHHYKESSPSSCQHQNSLEYVMSKIDHKSNRSHEDSANCIGIKKSFSDVQDMSTCTYTVEKPSIDILNSSSATYVVKKSCRTSRHAPSNYKYYQMKLQEFQKLERDVTDDIPPVFNQLSADLPDFHFPQQHVDSKKVKLGSHWYQGKISSGSRKSQVSRKQERSFPLEKKKISRAHCLPASPVKAVVSPLSKVTYQGMSKKKDPIWKEKYDTEYQYQDRTLPNTKDSFRSCSDGPCGEQIKTGFLSVEEKFKPVSPALNMSTSRTYFSTNVNKTGVQQTGSAVIVDHYCGLGSTSLNTSDCCLLEKKLNDLHSVITSPRFENSKSLNEETSINCKNFNENSTACTETLLSVPVSLSSQKMTDTTQSLLVNHNAHVNSNKKVKSVLNSTFTIGHTDFEVSLVGQDHSDSEHCVNRDSGYIFVDDNEIEDDTTYNADKSKYEEDGVISYVAAAKYTHKEGSVQNVDDMKYTAADTTVDPCDEHLVFCPKENEVNFLHSSDDEDIDGHEVLPTEDQNQPGVQVPTSFDQPMHGFHGESHISCEESLERNPTEMTDIVSQRDKRNGKHFKASSLINKSLLDAKKEKCVHQSSDTTAATLDQIRDSNDAPDSRDNASELSRNNSALYSSRKSASDSNRKAASGSGRKLIRSNGVRSRRDSISKSSRSGMSESTINIHNQEGSKRAHCMNQRSDNELSNVLNPAVKTTSHCVNKKSNIDLLNSNVLNPIVKTSKHMQEGSTEFARSLHSCQQKMTRARAINISIRLTDSHDLSVALKGQNSRKRKVKSNPVSYTEERVSALYTDKFSYDWEPKPDNQNIQCRKLARGRRNTLWLQNPSCNHSSDLKTKSGTKAKLQRLDSNERKHLRSLSPNQTFRLVDAALRENHQPMKMESQLPSHLFVEAESQEFCDNINKDVVSERKLRSKPKMISRHPVQSGRNEQESQPLTSDSIVAEKFKNDTKMSMAGKVNDSILVHTASLSPEIRNVSLDSDTAPVISENFNLCISGKYVHHNVQTAQPLELQNRCKQVKPVKRALSFNSAKTPVNGKHKSLHKKRLLEFSPPSMNAEDSSDPYEFKASFLLVPSISQPKLKNLKCVKNLLNSKRKKLKANSKGRRGSWTTGLDKFPVSISISDLVEQKQLHMNGHVKMTSAQDHRKLEHSVSAQSTNLQTQNLSSHSRNHLEGKQIKNYTDSHQELKLQNTNSPPTNRNSIPTDENIIYGSDHKELCQTVELSKLCQTTELSFNKPVSQPATNIPTTHGSVNTPEGLHHAYVNLTNLSAVSYPSENVLKQRTSLESKNQLLLGQDALNCKFLPQSWNPHLIKQRKMAPFPTHFTCGQLENFRSSPVLCTKPTINAQTDEGCFEEEILFLE